MEGKLKLRRRLAARVVRSDVSGFGLLWGGEVAGFFVLVGSWMVGVQVAYELVDADGRRVEKRRTSDRGRA